MADPVTIGLVSMGAGQALGAVGGVKANLDQADAERRNAAFYDEQAGFAQKAGERAEVTYRREAEQVYGAQVSAFARAGVDISGSPLLALANTQAKMSREISAIREDTEMNVRLARLRAQSSRESADSLSGFWNNAMRVTGSVLTGGGQIMAASGRGKV